MDNMTTHTATQSSARPSALATNKVLRNTYILLAMTMLLSAATATFAMVTNAGFVNPLITIVLYMGLIFGIQATAKSYVGLVLTFVLTGFLGYTLGPILNAYLATSAGTGIVTSALAITAFTFFALSAFVLITGKDMSFLGGMLFAGSMVILASVLVFFVLSLMGIQVTGLLLAISALSAFISCGYILYTTSSIIHGGETNYVLATVMLYVSIYSLFLNLLRILSFFSGSRN